MPSSLSKDEIIKLLPHREPMLLIEELFDIKKLFSATAVVNVKKSSFNLFRSATATKRRNPSPVRIIKYRGGLLMNAFNQQIIES